MTFLDRYLYTCGHSEVPLVFHRWSALALLASAVADRVWYKKFEAKTLTPSLFVFLLGASGTGKGEAIDHMLHVASGVDRLGVFAAQITAQGFIDYLEKQCKKGPEQAKVFLVMPELANDIGSGALADTFVKFMTNLATMSIVPFHNVTRTHGIKTFSGQCVNWLAGTTLQWLRESVSAEALRGGFFARVCAVEGMKDYSLRVEKPSYPGDFDVEIGNLRSYLQLLTCLEGEFTRSPEAQDVFSQWYQEREAPFDDAAAASWNRDHDRVLKLSMLSALSESPVLRIEARHVAEAQRLSEEVRKTLPSVTELSFLTTETEALRDVRRFVQDRHAVRLEVLARWAGQRGILADQLQRYSRTLEQGKFIQTVTTPTGTVIVWCGRRERRAL